MAKYCCKCKKKIGFFSATYFIGEQEICKKCANNVSVDCKDLKNIDEDLGRTDIFYSGLIIKSGIRIHPVFDEVTTEKDIENNLNKINNLPNNIKTKVLKVPQFKIFFENNIPYYTTQNNFEKKELPKVNGCYSYYDPVQDTEAYKLIIDDVEKLAQQKYEEEMIKEFGTKEVFGGVHRYYAIESHILYEKYGIHCINNPMSLNHDLYID